MKGLDLVRRDWCVQSKDTGRYVTDQILSGMVSETVLQNIHNHLEELAAAMRNGDLPLEKYVITKGLSRHPNDYPDAKSLPHVFVAQAMLKSNRAVNKGDHIPYIITVEPEASEGEAKKNTSSTERARHPDEIKRSDGALKPDIEWYLTQQILPPVSRLCEPIDGTSQAILAEKLGLDSKRFKSTSGPFNAADDQDLIDYVPASQLEDKKRFHDVDRIQMTCQKCNEDNEFRGFFWVEMGDGSPWVNSGLRCPNPACRHPLWGFNDKDDCVAAWKNKMDLWTRRITSQYYQGAMRCNETGCNLETRQLSVNGPACLRRGCTGRMSAAVSESTLYTHLKYLECLFSLDHACDQLVRYQGDASSALIKDLDKSKGTAVSRLKSLFSAKTTQLPKQDPSCLHELHQFAKRKLDSSAFNWISPSLFSFGSLKP
jgi:DNA polymerase alpha subunit A